MDDLINLVLNECMKIFNELHATDTCLGNYPKTALLKLHEYENDFSIGKILRVWKMSKDKIVELSDLSIEPNAMPHSKMYFNEAIFFLAVNEKNDLVNLTFQLGPRYGQVILYDIMCINNQKLLNNKRIIAVS